MKRITSIFCFVFSSAVLFAQEQNKTSSTVTQPTVRTGQSNANHTKGHTISNSKTHNSPPPKDSYSKQNASTGRTNEVKTIAHNIVVCIKLVFLILFIYLVYKICKIFYKFYKSRQTKIHDKKYNNVIYQEFMAIGETIEERGKNIKKLFENKEQTIHFQWKWKNNEQYYKIAKKKYVNNKRTFMQIDISRNIAIMEQREREFLRTTLLLFNENKLTEGEYCYYLFAFVNGNCKASILNWNALTHTEKTGVKDAPTTVKYMMDGWDATVESAISRLLQKIDNIGLQDNNHQSIKEIKSRIRGGGAWLTSEELEGTVFNNDGNYKVNLGFLDGSDTELHYSGEGSLITIAPPGSGKTQCYVLPNMLSWLGPAVVLDVKGEIYSSTSKWRSENVGPVYKFSPLDPANSHSYNPLVFINQDSDFIWEDSRFLADMMIIPSGTANPFWENMARDVLTAALAFVCMNNKPPERSMSKVIDIIYGIGWDEMVSALKTNVMVSAMKQQGYALSEMEKETRDGVLKTAQSSLSAWQGERITKVTKKSDWNPIDDLRNGKATIYICVNPNEIDSYLSILRVFIAQHIRILTSKLPERDAVPVLFMLDELPRLKKMPPIDEALNTGRQYGIKLWMFAQSYGQLKEAYPNAEGMIGSCAVQIYMNVPLQDELATKLSDKLGYRDGPLDATRQKLLEPLELAGPNYQDISIILASNTKPAKVRKSYNWQNKEMKKQIQQF